MSSVVLGEHPRAVVFQHSRWDALLVALAMAHGVLLVMFPGIALIALGLWWNSNSISHNFIHNPFFRSRALNRLFAIYLSVLLGYPQALWRAKHLAHHAGNKPKIRITSDLVSQTVLVISLWTTLGILVPTFFLMVYLPGWLIGMALCAVQGHYEHVRGTVSCYGRLYNLLFFNDGYHVEHHARPRKHWRELTASHRNESQSRWPPVLRWLEVFSLVSLERLVLRSKLLQRFVLRNHRRAFAKLLEDVSGIRRVGIIGGGLFPRTAIILRELLPDASLTVIDMSNESLAAAQKLLPRGITTRHEAFDAKLHSDFDLLIVPLSLKGDRGEIYNNPPASFVCIHDWIWRRRGKSAVISLLLFKRLNLVQQ